MAVPSFPHDLGPGYVTWNGVFVGETHGKITAKVHHASKDIMQDSYGEAPVDAVFTGLVVDEIGVPMTRATLTQLESIFHNSVKVNNSLNGPVAVGESMYDLAKSLIIVPYINNVASVVATEQIEFYKTYPVIDWTFDYDNASQRVFMVKFKVFPKQESPNIGDFYLIGTAVAP